METIQFSKNIDRPRPPPDKEGGEEERVVGERRRPNELNSCVLLHVTVRWIYYLLDKFLRLEVTPQVKHLPGGQAEQTAHAEDAKDQHPLICRLVCVTHLLLALPHHGECLHNRVRQVFQSFQVDFHGLQLSCFTVLQGESRRLVNKSEWGE